MSRLLVGKITTVHGVRGLVKVAVFGDDPALLNGTIHTEPAGDRTVTLAMKSSNGKHWLAEVEGVADRTAAEKLRSTELWVGRDRLPKLEHKNEHYVADLIGVTVRDQAGKDIGTLVAIENFGAGDLLDIQPISGENFYLPFTKDNILKIDTAAKVITIFLPEGIQ